MLNVRLDSKTEQKLKEYAERHDLSKSSVVKEALAVYLSQKELSDKPYELGSDLFGQVSSGYSDLSTNYKSKLKQKLREKHTH